MSNAQTLNIKTYCLAVATRAKEASSSLAILSTEVKNRWLRNSANIIRSESSALIEANALDLENAPSYGLTEAETDRLRLTTDRIEGIAQGLEVVASIPDPIGVVLEQTERPNGLRIEKRCVPLGVVFFIYESRPNVTADAAAICVKSGNAVILRGGKEAMHSSQAIVELLRRQAVVDGLPADAIQLVDTIDRAAVGEFLQLSEWIDLAIPRGGEGLIRRVCDEATMPVIKHFSGNCHVYVDSSADLAMAEAIIVNAKCQRMGVCNAAESLLVHADIAETFLPHIATALESHGIELRGDQKTCDLVPMAVEATEQDYSTEFLGPVISIAVVDSLDAAIEHINQYGSKHTDAIVAQDQTSINAFAARIDTSAVMINTSTRFNDGGEFGFGAEIGISTDKFHARGPCGVKELTSYKYIVTGSGQVRG